jgi:hypothetical protein
MNANSPQQAPGPILSDERIIQIWNLARRNVGDITIIFARAIAAEVAALAAVPEHITALRRIAQKSATDTGVSLTAAAAQHIAQEALDAVPGKGEPVAYRVAEFWSSANPKNKVRMLAEGDDIAQWAKRSDFIRWMDAAPVGEVVGEGGAK